MSLNFNSAGTARRVDHGSAASLDDLPATAFTAVAWVQRLANGANQHIFSKDQVTTNGWVLLADNGVAEGELRAVVRRSTGNVDFITSSPNVIPLNTWMMVALAYTFNSPAKIYLGSLSAPIAESSAYRSSSSGSGSYTSDAAASVYAGNIQRTNAHPFLGDIARTALFNRELSQGELLDLQRNWRPLSGCVLLTDYFSTAHANDLSGNQNSGTANLVTTDPHVPVRPALLRPPRYQKVAGTVYNDTLSESLTSSAGLSTTATFPNTLSQAVTAASALATAATFPNAFNSAITAADSISTGSVFSESVSEGLTASDTSSAAATLANTLSEALTGSDGLSAGTLLTLPLTETVTAGESITSIGQFSDALSEMLTASDVLTAAGGATHVEPNIAYRRRRAKTVDYGTPIMRNVGR